MKLLLKDFQADAVEQLVKQLRSAAIEARQGQHQSVVLASPTGSGKTVMATAAIENILQGSDEKPPRPDAVFLWITDQPELNEQTRRKMLAASSLLSNSTLQVIDSSFDQELLQKGTVHFLNIQKLGREKDLVTRGDKRTYTIWETIANTAAACPEKLFVIIDEAHRGMAENPRARATAATIIQKFIKGSPGELPPIPLIVGVSATPERFHRLIEGTTRTNRPVVVPPEDVRASGLLKQVITLYHPTASQPTDITMLRAAAAASKKFAKHWETYCSQNNEPLLEPILVVQVQDGSAKQISKTDIAEAIHVINEELGHLPQDAFAHAFQEGTRLDIGEQELRYLSPPDIHADSDVRVVFFKTSLNTGWDCPRAEVMMSFRKAVDATLIAQLVGRMVRTPLARNVETNEFLNTVSLYLPHYDPSGLDSVISRLTTPDADLIPPVDVAKGEDVITLSRAKGSEAAFEALETLPSYVIPRSTKSSELRRLMKLSRLLAHDEIHEDAPETATESMLKVLNAQHARLTRTKQFRSIVKESGTVEIRGVNWQVGTDIVEDEAATLKLDLSTENVDDIFDAAGRKLGEGIHKAWWRLRVDKGNVTPDKAKLELFALCIDHNVLKAVESAANKLVQKWLKAHSTPIGQLPEGRHQAYNEVRRLAAKPEVVPLTYPEAIEARKQPQTWKNHLFVDSKSMFSAKLNRWETQVIEEEMKRKDFVAWLRNPDRKPWSVCIPYDLAGECRAFYPDFLVIRKKSGRLVVDLLDPHAIDLADAPSKAVGLAQYAASHAHDFGRIELIIISDKQIQRLDLTDEGIRNKVRAVKTQDHLQALFDIL